MNIDFLYILETEYPEISERLITDQWRHLWHQPVYKIGRSNNPIRRNQEVGPFKIVSVVPVEPLSASILESSAHRRWSAFRLPKNIGWYIGQSGHGEWFFFPTTRERLIFHHWITSDLTNFSRRSLGVEIAESFENILEVSH